MQDVVETDPNYVPAPGRFTSVWNEITNQLDDMILTYSPSETSVAESETKIDSKTSPPISSNVSTANSPSSTAKTQKPVPPPNRPPATPQNGTSTKTSNIPNSASESPHKGVAPINNRSNTVVPSQVPTKDRNNIQRANTALILNEGVKQPIPRALSPQPTRPTNIPKIPDKGVPPVPPKKASQPSPVPVVKKETDDVAKSPPAPAQRSASHEGRPTPRGLTVSSHRESPKVVDSALPSAQSVQIKKSDTPPNMTKPAPTKATLNSAEKRKMLEEKLNNMHGYLTKQGHVVKNWQMRFFVSDPKLKELSYFVDNTRKQLKGTVSLGGASVEELQGNWDGRENCFVLKTSQKDFILSASSKKERMQWFYAIDFCINGTIAILTIKDDEVEKLVSSFAIGETTNEVAPPRPTILAPVANMSIPFVSCAGWVEKKGHKNTAWQRRWLVLSDPKQTYCKSMLYFESNENGGSNKKGEVILVGGTIERVKEIGKKRNCFIIHTVRDTKPIDFELATDTFEECEQWIKCIGEAIDFLKTTKLQYSGQQGTF